MDNCLVPLSRVEVLEALQEQLRILPDTASDAGFRSPFGRGAAWLAKTSALICEIDMTRGAFFRARGTDLIRVGSSGGHREEFMSLLAEVSMLLESEVAVVTAESPKDFDQKFQIVFSARQAERDYIELRKQLGPEIPIAVLFVDLDHFGDLNAQHTEELVDRDLLPPLMRLLLSICTTRGHVYRQGGDEFILLLPNTELVEARQFAERLLLILAQTPFSIGGHSKNITASIGVATSSPSSDYNELAPVRARANERKKEAKRTRNCVRS